MRTFTLRTSSSLSLRDMWNYFADIQHYPGRITFVKRIASFEGIKEGAVWCDITTIVWVPLKIPHKIISWKKEKEVVYGVTMPFGGTMKEEVLLQKEGAGSSITCTVSFDLGNPISNSLMGWLLEKRLRYMIISTMRGIDKDAQIYE